MCPVLKILESTTILCLFFAGSNHGRMRVQVAITQGKRAQRGNEEMQKAIGREKKNTEKLLRHRMCTENKEHAGNKGMQRERRGWDGHLGRHVGKS